MPDTLDEIELRVHGALKDIDEHGDVVQRAMLDGALALLEAHAAELYKVKAKSFDEWVHDEFGIHKRTAYKWLECAQVHLGLVAGECKLLPDTQAQYKRLVSVPDEQQPVVWDAAVAAANSGQPSKKQVTAAIKEVLGPPVEQPAIVEPVPVEPGSVKDILGQPVPDNLAAIFTDGYFRLRSIARDLAALAKELRALRKKPIGEYMPQSVVAEIASARKSILWAVPYAVASEALKERVADGNETESMEQLVRVGWMPKEICERLPENLR